MATRDLLSFGEIFKTIPQEITLGKSKEQLQKEDIVEDDETIETKVTVNSLWSGFIWCWIVQ